MTMAHGRRVNHSKLAMTGDLDDSCILEISCQPSPLSFDSPTDVSTINLPRRPNPKSQQYGARGRPKTFRGPVIVRLSSCSTSVLFHVTLHPEQKRPQQDHEMSTQPVRRDPGPKFRAE